MCLNFGGNFSLDAIPTLLTDGDSRHPTLSDGNVVLARALFGDDADLCLTCSHRLLEGDTPAQRLDQGYAEAVLQVLEALATGAYE